MDSKRKGMLAAVGSALVFGFTPILARASYDGGANGVSLTFLRAVITLPILYAILRFRGISARLNRKQMQGVAIGGLGYALTSLLLYSSYSYINVGMSTTLHFVYPLLVVLAGVFLFKEKMTLLKAAALALALLGIAAFFEAGEMKNMLGVVLALASGVVYAFYILCLNHSAMNTVPYFTLTFYTGLIMAVVAGIYGFARGDISFALTGEAWLYVLGGALLNALVATTLFQVGVRLAGASTAAMLSVLEPITSVIFGMLLLGEGTTLQKAAGCLLILCSVVLITAAEAKTDKG